MKVPDNWKKANVVPIFKEYQKVQTSQPLSHSQENHSLLKNGPGDKHAFTKGKSCLMNLSDSMIKVLDFWMTGEM